MTPPFAPDSDHDPLTGLLNRRAFTAALERVVERSRNVNSSVALLSVDLNHFNRVNKAYGLRDGDGVMVRFATLLESAAVEAACTGRTAGDEFEMYVPGLTARDLAGVAEWLRVAAKADLELYGVTASIGVADTRNHAGVRDLRDAARQAVYRAKQGGRDRVVVAGD